MERASPLRLLRVSQGHRLCDVEAGTRIPDTIISRIERGQTALNQPRLARLAAFYRVSPSVLAASMRTWRASRAGVVARVVELEAPKPPDASA